MEEFWGVEVKSGQSLKVSPGNGLVLRISQASLGELRGEKGKENVNLFVNVDGKKLVLGTLITNKLPQHHFDLLFDRDFEISHNWKSGSVYYYGYRTSKTFEDELLVGESDGKKTAPVLVTEAMNAPLANQPNEKNPVKIPCKMCTRSFTSEKGVEDHTKDMHGVGPSHDGNKIAPFHGNETTKVPPTNKPNKEILKKALCSICNRLFGSEQVLEIHTKAMHDGNKVAPLFGNEATKVAPTYKPNMEILKKVPCSICNRLFDSTKGLETHTKAKHDESKSKEDIPLYLETNGKTESMVNKEKHTDAERPTASNDKESDSGREPVKIAETCKHVNTKEDEETTFEDVMTDDDDIADPQVVTSKKRPLESVESATLTSIAQKKSRRKKKKAKVISEGTDGNENAPLLGNEATRAPPTNYRDENTPRNNLQELQQVHLSPGDGSNLQCT